MKKQLSLIQLACMMMLANLSTLVRARTHDVAFSFRMGAGFAGDVNRTHPASILPGVQDTTNAIRLYGDPVFLTATGTYKGLLVSDTGLTKIDGVIVRPFPTQQSSGGMSSALGAVVPPVGPAVIDVLREGYIQVRCNNFATLQPVKGGAVFVWFAANSGGDIQGGFRSAANASAIAITNAKWTGPCDSNGIGEIEVWAA